MPLLEVLGLARRDRAGSVDAPPRGDPVEGRARSKSEGATPEIARFEARWAKLATRIAALRDDVRTKRLGSPPPPALEAALNAFTEGADRAEAAKAAGDGAKANQAMDVVEKAIAAFDGAFPAENDKAKKAYEAAKAKAAAFIQRFDASVKAGRFGAPPAPRIAEIVDDWAATQELMKAAEPGGNYVVGLRGLRRVTMIQNVLKQVTADIDDDWKKLEPSASKLVAGIDGGAFPGADGKALKAAVATGRTAVPRATSNDEVAAALAAIDAVQKGVPAFRKAVAQAFTAGAKDPKASRAGAMKLMKQDPELLKAIADEPGGAALMDKMVGDLGGKAKTPDDKAFVRGAITARFGPKLTDRDLTTKYLPRLYATLGKVPASHTLGNPMLKEIDRTRTKVVSEGDYTPGAGRINLVTPRTGLIDSMESFLAGAIPNVLGSRKVSIFDALTLHEVAHSVDDAKKFMDGKTGNVSFGGWQTHKIEEVAAFVAQGKGMVADFSALGRPFLNAYLIAVLKKVKDPSKDPTVVQAVPAGAKPDWKALARHAAVECCERIRMKGKSSGLWDGGDGAAQKAAIGGSVYQESYANQWVSYALSARGAKVTDYQFRSEAEWYAECYAAYFLGKLKKEHPLHALLKADESSNKAAQRAAR
jgi:hypothetical protein